MNNGLDNQPLSVLASRSVTVAESVGLLVLESVVDSLVFGMGFNSLTVATVDSLKEKDTFPRKTNECPLKNGGWKTSLSV